MASHEEIELLNPYQMASQELGKKAWLRESELDPYPRAASSSEVHGLKSRNYSVTLVFS